MKNHLAYFAKGLVFFSVVFSGHAIAGQSGKMPINDTYQISGPYAHKNLSVFLVHSKMENKPDAKNQHYLSLAEALESGTVTLHETGDVQNLSASNHSKTAYVFVQAGDIVKGGRQDRTLAQDIILPPKAKHVPIDSFCVEQGRWSKRGNEKSDRFSSSKKGLSSKALKLAAKKSKSQEAVWKAVADEQEKLERKIGKSVRHKTSATSLQLSLEDKDVEKESRDYQKALCPIGQRAKDAVGFAFTINGQFSSADIYGDPTLFQKLWPKLIETAACEAFAMSDAEKSPPSPPELADIKGHIQDALTSSNSATSSTPLTKRATGETPHDYTFQTKDKKGHLVHLNIIKK